MKLIKRKNCTEKHQFLNRHGTLSVGDVRDIKQLLQMTLALDKLNLLFATVTSVDMQINFPNKQCAQLDLANIYEQLLRAKVL